MEKNKNVKKRKVHVQFKNLYKKDKNEQKRDAFFAFISTFSILNLKIHAKKTKMQKKIQIRKIYAKMVLLKNCI